MGGLNGALAVAAGALNAQEVAIATINNNIANANTPGYSREVVNLAAAATSSFDGVEVGDGVDATSVTSVRDQLISLITQQQTSAQSAASAASNVLTGVQTYFSTASGTVGDALSTFFSSLSALSADPSNTADRQTVIGNAQDLVQAFQSTSSGLTSAQTGLNTQISGDVAQINQLSSQIASLNAQITSAGHAASGTSTLEDQRSELEQQLSTFTNVAVTTSADGDTITTGSGTPLVVANQSLALATSAGSNGLSQVVDSNDNTVTSDLTQGDLGGILSARDTTIPAFLSQLDTLANNFAQAFNSAHESGYDLNGNAGTALFSVPASVSGSAAAIALTTTSTSAIAASSNGSAGNSGNVAALTGVQSAPLASGLSPTDSYASIVDAVGSAVSDANTQSTALQSSLTQLANQQSAISGVSINEESTNLIQYQQAYEAAAEVVTTINSLFSQTLNMLSASN